MAWNEKRSRERVKKNDFSDFEVNVQDLSRSMDFTKLGKKDVRRVQGVHLYVDVPNFHRAVDDAGNDKQKQRKLVRASSVLRRIQGSLMSDDDVGDIQRQTVRAHGLVFKPYNGKDTPKDGDRAKKAVIHAITQNTYVLDVFNGVFSDVRDFSSAVGLASGTSYICNIGKTGKRELISLGTCANVAAKIIGGRDSITITDEMYNVLPECLQDEFEKDKVVADVQTYRATGIRWSRNTELAEELGVEWDEEKWKKETEKHRDNLPLDKINIAEATTLIDVSKLTERNCKRTDAVTFYADLDGFTRYVQEAETDDKVISLIRQFHMIRAEFHSVVGTDYDGLALQHRGDCILGILHLPSGNGKHDERCQDAVDLAIGLQSSMEHVLNEHLTDREDIHVAVGMDVGKVIVSRLGKQGERITICFGPEVTEAERLQTISAAKQIRISSEIYDQLDDEDITKEFTKRGSAYVATNLTFPKLDEKKEEKAAEAGSLGANVNDGRIRVTTAATAKAARPWHEANRGGRSESMCWHDADPDRWKQEQEIASQLLEDFEAGIDSNQTAYIRGTFGVYSEHGHLYESAMLRIVYPATFPARNQPPSVYLESHRDRWKNSGDSHIETDWRLCLFVPGESGIDFSSPTALNELFAVIHTFLFKQRIYQKRLAKTLITGGIAKWPGEDRSHGEQGIREAIRAMGGVGRNDPCPCGSGKKYKKCHMRKFERR